MNLQTHVMSGARAIVEILKIQEISKVFCVPGESYLPLLDALYDEPDIDVISARHEGGAAFMAEGYAKEALKPAAVLATRAVGAANLMIGVHTAYQDSTPMIVFLGQVDSRFRGREGFQELDLDVIFNKIAKWAVEINDVERIPELVQRAIRTAISGRPGPVVISLPENLLVKKAYMTFAEKINRPKPRLSKGEMIQVENLLNEIKKPVIIAGGGIKSAKAEELLAQFADKFSIPVLTAFRRHDSFPNLHPLYAGHLGLSTHPEILKTIHEADCIIAIGSRLSEVTTQDYSIITTDKKLIHIDIDGSSIGKTFPPDIGIISDAKEALSALLEMVVPVTWTEWAKERNGAYRKANRLQVSKQDVINKHIIDVLIRKLPENTIITNDAGNFAAWLHAFYPFEKKHSYVGPTSGAMGYGMPASIGAKLASPEKYVISLAGDGGFMMTFQELETAVRYQIPIISLVFNNKMYGTIRMHQEIHYPYRVIGTDLGDVSFKKMAESVGAKGFCVCMRHEFESALEEALKSNHPTVIEILTDPDQITINQTISDLRKQ